MAQTDNFEIFYFVGTVFINSYAAFCHGTTSIDPSVPALTFTVGRSMYYSQVVISEPYKWIAHNWKLLCVKDIVRQN